jgi:hypothetical protein
VNAKEVAFIDPTISELGVLLSVLRPGVQAVILNRSEPALAQIAASVKRRSGTAVIHIIAHGGPGEVRFAAGPLSLKTIGEHAGALLSIGQALDGGELLLWSCDAGGGEDGVAFIEALARATGANVAASAGPIGSIAHGGHWQLDVGSAAIRSVAPLTAMGIAAYPGIMAIKIKDATIGSISTDTGSSSTDFVTDDTGPSFSGLVNTVGSGASDTLDIFLVGGVFGTGNGTLIGTVPISASGAWSFNLAASRVVAARTLTDGTYTIRLAEGGPPSKTLASQTLVIDTTAPSAPSTPEVVAASDSGISSTDNITTVTTPTFTGAAEANSRVTLFDGTTPVGSATANGSGNWSITSTVLAQGTHQITAKAADTAGNLSVASVALSVMIDTIAPAMTAGLVSDTGASESDKITSNPGLSGSGDPNAVVHFTIDGSPIADTATAGASGVWTFAPTGLADGAHTIIASETDAAGNTGSASLSFTLDTRSPTISFAPISGDNIVDAAEAAAGFTISGVAADTNVDGQTVTIAIVDASDTLHTSYTATVAAGGGWSIDVTPAQAQALASGDYTVKGDVADVAGNPAVEATLAITVEKPAQPYTALDAPDAIETYANGINNTGDVTGYYFDNNGTHGFLYGGIGYTTLDAPDGFQTYALSVNDTGEVAGYYFDSVGTHGFLYNGGGYITLNAPASSQTYAQAINGAGEVAGYYQVDDVTHGFLYADGVFTTLDAAGSTQTYALAVNATGEVAGYYYQDGDAHGFLFDGAGFTTLDVPDSSQTYALSVNATGEVAGYYQDGAGTHGFIYDNGTYIPLNFPGSSQTYAQAINATGEVAGYYQDGAATHGFLYDGGVYTNVEAPGSLWSVAQALNDTGEVAGYYSTPPIISFLFSGGAYATLDVPGSTGTYAQAINGTGEIAGFYGDSTGTHGFLYAGGASTTLDAPNSSQTYAQAISGTGKVAGYNFDGGKYHGFLYDGGVYTPLDVSGSTGTYAQAVNDTGEVAGYYFNGGKSHGFLYDGATCTPLDVSGSTYTIAQAINDGGEVVGTYGDSGGTHSFRYDGGAYATLNVSGSTNTVATAINDTGEIGGYYQDGGGTHGFTFDDIGYTTLDVPNSSATYIQAINDAGSVAGYYFDAAGQRHGFVYDGSSYTTVNGPSASNGTYALGISDTGEVAGYYRPQQLTHGFIAAPTG